MHIPKEISSFFNLKNTGLIVGYAQFFLSAIFINSVPAPMIISVIMAITLFLSVPWIYGILSDEPTFMRPSLVWAKYVYIFGIIYSILTLIVEVYLCIYSIFFYYGRYSFWQANRTFLYWIGITVATVIQDFFTTQMNSLYKIMKNAADNIEEPKAASDYSTLHTFWLINAVAKLIADFSERIYDKVKCHSNRIQEFISREWDELFRRSRGNTTPKQIMTSKVDQVAKEEKENLNNVIINT